MCYICNNDAENCKTWLKTKPMAEKTMLGRCYDCKLYHVYIDYQIPLVWSIGVKQWFIITIIPRYHDHGSYQWMTLLQLTSQGMTLEFQGMIKVTFHDHP